MYRYTHIHLYAVSTAGSGVLTPPNTHTHTHTYDASIPRSDPPCPPPQAKWGETATREVVDRYYAFLSQVTIMCGQV